MKTLKRNQKLIKFKNYLSKTPKTDSSGNYTGEYIKAYGDVITEAFNVSEESGNAFEKYFGKSCEYSKVLVGSYTEMDENSILWIDDTDTTHNHDYVVSAISRSLNSVRIAVKKVR